MNKFAEFDGKVHKVAPNNNLKVTSETGYAQLGFKTTEKQQNNQYMKVYREAMNPEAVQRANKTAYENRREKMKKDPAFAEKERERVAKNTRNYRERKKNSKRD